MFWMERANALNSLSPVTPAPAICCHFFSLLSEVARVSLPTPQLLHSLPGRQSAPRAVHVNTLQPIKYSLRALAAAASRRGAVLVTLAQNLEP